MKERRPERFSDSVSREVGKLDRGFLEYQLDTLNRRNKELAFEGFAKQLCERVICPNLLEQTGPVAGGDGKVDSQTFPVSEQSKLCWFRSDGHLPSVLKKSGNQSVGGIFGRSRIRIGITQRPFS